MGGDKPRLAGAAIWLVRDPGDGSDMVEGQAGFDMPVFNGGNAKANSSLAANGGRVLLLRNVAALGMDLNDMEEVQLQALGGAGVVISDLATEVFIANFDAIDRLVNNARGRDDAVEASGLSSAAGCWRPAAGPAKSWGRAMGSTPQRPLAHSGRWCAG